jgi:ACS family tartrate transporter-like MFS transporter
VRILLGVAEAGFFPGIVLYLTYWFPARERARAMAFFMTGVAISGVISNIVSGIIMDVMPGVAGLKGWQWLFVLEGIPSILVGFFVWWYLPDGPKSAKWLSDAERGELSERLGREDAYRHKHQGGNMLRALQDWRVWLLVVAYFTVAVGTNTAAFSFAKMVKIRFHEFSESQKGFLVALPSLCALGLMLVLGRLSDLTKMRRTMFAVAGIIGALGWLGVIFLHQPWPLPALEKGVSPSLSPEQMDTRWLFLGALCLAQAGMISMIPTFWVLPTSFLTGTAAAAGIALINSLGNLGGLVGSSIFDELGHYSIMLIVLFGGLVVYLVRHDPTLDRGISAKPEG